MNPTYFIAILSVLLLTAPAQAVIPPAAELLTFVHNDHLGTPVAMTDDQATVVWRATKKPFGETTVDEDPDGDGLDLTLHIRFPGQYYDGETGMHYNWYRYYDASIGRYSRSDPIGLHGGLTPYPYVLNDPVTHSDVLGLYTFGRWVYGPSLSVTKNYLRKMRVAEHWTIIPPAVGLGGDWWMIYGNFNGMLECGDDEECGGDADIFNVEFRLGKEVGIGWGITTNQWLTTARKIAHAFSTIGEAVEFYENEWRPLVVDMAKNPLTWCIIIGISGPSS